MGDTPAHVAARATIRNGLDTRSLTLLGVVETPGERRALVRLPSGRIRTVRAGDLLAGGRILAIGPTELRYRTARRIRILTLPP